MSPRKYNLDEMSFSTITQNSCYWAGFIASDGCIYENMVKITLKNCDKKHLEKFLYFLKANYKIKDNGKYSTVCIYSKQMIQDLFSLFNIYPKKSLNISMPNLQNDMLRHYIRGYFDGDGCIKFNKRRSLIHISIVSGSQKQIEDIKNRVFGQTNIQLCFYKYNRKNGNNVYVVEKCGTQAELFLQWLYNDSTYYLDRKFNKLDEYRILREVFINNLLQKKYEKRFQGRNREIYNLIKSGMPRKDVAKMFGLAVSSCNYIMKNFKEVGL